MRFPAKLLLLLAPVALLSLTIADRRADARVLESTSTSRIADGAGAATVTVYGATWCPACKSLEATLRTRGVPFELVDVDSEPGRYELARKAAGTNSIPLTNVRSGPNVSWIVGNDADAVERAFKGG